jgi:G3E family GTPase
VIERFPDFTPIILLTGFLGSGKTTLLKQILADPGFGDSAVIINEFGEVGLDHHLIEHVADDVVVLPSGCLCCAMKGELAATLRDLQSRRGRGAIPAFRRVIVESSGLADPYPVISTVKAEPVLRHHFRLATVLTAVDAVNGAGTLDRHVESVRQAAVADTLILTKTDLAAAADVVSLRERLVDLNPAAPIVLAAGGSIDLKALVEDGGSAIRRRDTANAWRGHSIVLADRRCPAGLDHVRDLADHAGQSAWGGHPARQGHPVDPR